MSKEQLSKRNFGVFILVVAVLMMGAILAMNRPTSAVTGPSGAQKTTHVVHANAATLPANGGMGYAATLKPALPAVVNISSSKVVKAPGGWPFEFFNDPLFQQFFGDQFRGFQMTREQRQRSLILTPLSPAGS